MAVFKCKMCGGSLEIKDGESTAVCEYCGTRQTLPRLDDERRANLYDRANHFRRNNEFDKAMSIYEQILNDDKTDAEAYWSIVLCRYGIEYVEDSSTQKRVPTVNRTQYASVLSDADYKSAIQYADGYQRDIYEAEAKVIDEIQKGILAVSKNEKLFDVFICYKETDGVGHRTPDSVFAGELYHQLTQEGFKVFYSRVTLEDKLGSAYEPYIFAALNSAKVMVAIGTKPEYFNAAWVKNEWGRYLSLIKNGAKKTLIPAYKDMDPYDLPEDFSHLQAQDMSKLGFMQDLIRGVKKLAASEHEITPTVATASSGSGTNVAALLKRAFIFLEDGEWKSADDYCEKVLDLEPENADAYVGKLMAELQTKCRSNLADSPEPLEKYNTYQKAIRFGDEKLKSELEEYNKSIIQRNENTRLEKTYKQAENTMRWGFDCKETTMLKEAAELFKSIPMYKDSFEKAETCLKKIEELKAERKVYFEKVIHISAIVLSVACVCIAFIVIIDKSITPLFRYKNAMECIADGQYEEGYSKLTELGDYKDSAEQIKISKYDRALIYIKSGSYDEGYLLLEEIGDYKDSTEQINISKYDRTKAYMVNKKYSEGCSLLKEIAGYKDACSLLAKYCFNKFRNFISAGCYITFGLKHDGTVIATGKNIYDANDVSGFCDIVAVSAVWHTVGLKSDGTVVATGDNNDGQCNVSDWTDIIAVSAGWYHTIGLKSDGTVVATGGNDSGQCNVSGWTNINAVIAAYNHTIGLKSDGTVVATGNNDDGQCDVSDWKDIIAVSAGWHHTVGLKSDGSVVATGDNYFGQCDVSDWTKIVAISACDLNTIGLKADGTVVAAGIGPDGECDVSRWRNIVAISAGKSHTLGLKSDGTVVATGYNGSGQCDVSDWDLF